MQRVKITTKMLEAAGACRDGIAAFDAAFPAGVDTEWTWLHSVMAAKIVPMWIDWGIVRGIVPAPCLSGADLSGANLRGANLRGSDLRGSDLSGSDLRGANLRGSDLRGSDLSGSDLRGSDLHGAVGYP